MRPVPTSIAVPSTGCEKPLDVAALLASHGERFGDDARLERLLPLTITYSYEDGGSRGEYVIDISRRSWRERESAAGITRGDGVDDEGSWMLRSAGVVVRPRIGRESIDLAFREWVLRRRYVSTEPSSARCDRNDGRELVTVAYERVDLGSPRLVFDRDTAALVRVAHTGPDGQFFLSKPLRWTAPDDRGMRFPENTTADAASVAPARFVDATTSSACDASGAFHERCLAPPPPSFVVRWPAGSRIRMPFVYEHGELLVRAKIAKREVWAMIDSGTTISAIRTNSITARAKRGGHAVTASGVAQIVQMSEGSLDRVTLGGLALEHLPVATVDAQSFAKLGSKAPELVVGIGLFAVATVQIDFADKAIELTPPDRAPAPTDATPVPLELVRNLLRAQGSIDGRPAEVAIDTGSGAAWVLHRGWLDTPVDEAGKASSFATHAGVGAELERITTITLRSAELGPLRERQRSAYVVDAPVEGRSAGFVGNPLLSRCRAVVLDFRRRTLWFERPCSP